MERLDTYLCQHQKTDHVVYRGDYENLFPGEFLMVVHLCIFNSRGEMLIQRRQLHKDRYPGMWDLSAGGFVQSGETVNDAVLREAHEELGIQLAPESIRYIMTVPFSFVLDGFFTAQVDCEIRDLVLQEEEVLESKWAAQDEILQLCKEGQFVDYDVNLLSYCFSIVQSRG